MTNKGFCEPVRLLEIYGEGDTLIVENKLMTRLITSEKGNVLSQLNTLIDKKTNYIKIIAKSSGIDDSQISFNEKQQTVLQKTLNNPIHGIALKKDKSSKVYLGNSVLSQHQKDTLEDIQGYKLSRSIIVNFKNIEQKRLFLGQVSHITQQDVSQSLSMEERQSYYQKALIKAIDNALMKARLITKKTGVKLGHIVFLKELTSVFLNTDNNNKNTILSSRIKNHYDVTQPRVLARVLIKFKLIK